MTQGNSTNKYACANFIVAPTFSEGSTHTTIASALSAASSGDTIFLKPGTYEEDITLKAGVNLTAFPCDIYNDQVVILGKATATFDGQATISNIRFTTNSDNSISITGSNTTVLRFENCFFNGADATSFDINNANSSVVLQKCTCSTSSNNLIFAITTTAGVTCNYCVMGAGTNANTIAAGTIFFYHCSMNSFSLTTSATGSFNVYNCMVSQSNAAAFTLVGTGNGNITNTEIFSGTATAIAVGTGTTLNISCCVIDSSNTDSISGAGTVEYSSVAYSSTTNGINATTETGYYVDLGKSRARSQPAFLAYLGTTDSNVTGNGATYVLGSTGNALTETFDQGGDFVTTGTFTAPVDGRYYFKVGSRIGGTSASTNGNLRIITSNVSYNVIGNANPINVKSSGAGWCPQSEVFTNMDAADTCVFHVLGTGEASDVWDIIAGEGVTFCSGYLVC